MRDRRPTAAAIGAVLLAAVTRYLTDEVRWMWVAIALAAIFLVAYSLAGSDDDDDEDVEAAYEARVVVDPSGRILLKLSGPQRPPLWNCIVVSFSGEWRAYVHKHRGLAREPSWSANEIVVVLPDDFPGRPPPPGTYEVTWFQTVVDEHHSVLDTPIAKAEFRVD